MGVSIEGFLEIADARGGWRFAGGMVPNRDDPERPAMSPKPFFESESKELAAILTGSGNPIRSAEPYATVVAPRGLPRDLSSEVAGWLRPDEGEPWFASTWFTAREALAFDWNRIMRRRAMVDPRAAGLFASLPRGFQRAGWPPDVPVSYASYRQGGVTVEWLEPYADIAADFHSGVLPRLAEAGPPDAVRLAIAASW